MIQAPRNPILDPLRGLAALSVVLFHFGASILPTITPNILTNGLVHGKLGIQVFFVISGYVIPVALKRMGYTFKDLGTFMARRFVRIAPPAYASAVLMVLYHYLSIWFKGEPVSGSGITVIDLRTILANLTFSAVYLDTAWFNFAYWTLTIEFEFYLLMGLLFPLFLGTHRVAAALFSIVFLFSIRAFQGPLLFEHGIYFIPGLLIFFRQERTLNDTLLLVAASGCLAIGLLTGEVLAGVVSLITGFVILAGPPVRARWLTWLGTISYSLYIMHIPVAFYTESALKRITDLHHSAAGKLLLLVVYVLAAILAASVFHRLVERPFLDLSKNIGKRVRPAPDPTP